jgi:hypothetical protein
MPEGLEEVGVEEVVESLRHTNRVVGIEQSMSLEVLADALGAFRRQFPAQWRPRLPITIAGFEITAGRGRCWFDLPASIEFISCRFVGSNRVIFTSLRCHDLKFKDCDFNTQMVVDDPHLSGDLIIDDVFATSGILLRDLVVEGDVRFVRLNVRQMHQVSRRPSQLTLERGSVGRRFIFQESSASSVDVRDLAVGKSFSFSNCGSFERSDKFGTEEHERASRDDEIVVAGCRIGDRCVIEDVRRVAFIALESTVVGRDLLICGVDAGRVEVDGVRVMARAEVGGFTTVIGDLSFAAIEVRHDLVVDLRNQGRLSRLKVDRSIISGNLVLSGCPITFADGKAPGEPEEALQIVHTSVAGSLHADRTKIRGDVSFEASWIGRNLRFDQADITTASRPIDLAGVFVGGTVSFVAADKNSRTTLGGGITLEEARVGGITLSQGVSIENPRGGSALMTWRNLSCGSSLEFSGMRLRGRIDLSGAELKGDLRLRGAKITVADLSGKAGATFVAEHVAIDLRDAKIGRLEMPDEADAIQGFVDLRGCTAATLVDRHTSWTETKGPRSVLLLSGFNYSRLENPTGCREKQVGGNTVHPRVEWLERAHGEGGREPLRQLARTLRAQGDPDGAERVVLDFRRSQRRQKRGLGWLLDLLLDVCARYGYEPTRALHVSIGALFAFGLFWSLAAYFGCSEQGCHDQSLFVRTLPGDFATNEEEKLRAVYPAFNGFAYSVDLFFPFVDLGMDSRWMPNVSGCPDSARHSGFCSSDRRFVLGQLLYWLAWIEIVAGTLLTALTVTSFTGVLRPEDSDR